MSSSGEKQDLVKAKLSVRAPAKSTLTGALPGVISTGKNTGWNKVTRGSTMKYTDRVSYLAKEGMGHSLPTSMAARHVGETAPEDKRGATCAEAGAILSAHSFMARKGMGVAKQNFDAFKQSIFEHHAKEQSLPPKPSMAWGSAGEKYRELEKPVQDATTADLADHLAFTGMSSWQEYAKAESSYMAWNDIQQHGKFTDIRHDETSDISPGKVMAPCEHCRHDTLSKVKAHAEDL